MYLATLYSTLYICCIMNYLINYTGFLVHITILMRNIKLIFVSELNEYDKICNKSKLMTLHIFSILHNRSFVAQLASAFDC